MNRPRKPAERTSRIQLTTTTPLTNLSAPAMILDEDVDPGGGPEHGTGQHHDVVLDESVQEETGHGTNTKS